jgi:probable rRNA maturation factor
MMMKDDEGYDISVQVADAFTEDVNEDALREAAESALSYVGAEEGAGLTIIITDDEVIRNLNARYRDIDAPTDVLSFEADLPGEPVYLGDILIAYPYTAAQAAEGGHAVIDELRLMVVHGALHLLGYDHAEPADKDEMWAIQRRLLPGVAPDA